MPVLLSVVSHQQADLVFQLLMDIQHYCLHKDMEVMVTINIKEKIPFKPDDFDFKLRVFQNDHSRGFGANHNAAFKMGGSNFFCILNPDIRLSQDPFPLLIDKASDRKTGVVAPLIKNNENGIEDSARRLPTPLRLLRRILTAPKSDRLDYPIGQESISPDWVAGIFMLFPSPVFAEMNGFDERYFLYLEDADLCCRLKLAGYKIMLDPRVSVIHNARRDSHKSRPYLRWHVQSAARFFGSRVFWSLWSAQFRMKFKKTL
jgi:N-acetylglucosaminyl-diphospho-decaprenol L-rhamnosyltransferase